MKNRHIAENQLDRIENGIRALLHRVYFPTINAWYGLKGEELTNAMTRESENKQKIIEQILAGEFQSW
jgi:hypothetical protein